MALELDLHGFTIPQALYEIQRTIIANPKCNCIEIIHGYNQGNKIKHFLRDKNNIHNRRVIRTIPVPLNDGRTFIFLKT
ncbi:MAG: Smr/MutS family protein [Anaeroplasmataceae bacterium]|nr:Smr/MutS family protein [Anaeroplasmataceae bacterium]